MTTRIKIRRDTTTNWHSNNPVLALGEPAYDTDLNKLKIGDGNSGYNSLDYLGSDVVYPYVELTNQAAPLNIWAGPQVTFVHTNNGSEIDHIDTGLSITRAQNQGIYNSALEEGWDNTYGDPDGRASPKGTVWNSDGWNTLTNLDQRTYTTFYNKIGRAHV